MLHVFAGGFGIISGLDPDPMSLGFRGALSFLSDISLGDFKKKKRQP